MQYRRLYIPGGSYFFTVVTQNRQKIFQDESTVQVLRQAFHKVRKEREFTIDAMVVLPDHLHSVWTMPPDDDDFSTRWRLVKTWFTKHCGSTVKQGRSIWQNRYWEHMLRSQDDFNQHLDYIHYNPVKHDYVQRPVEWPYSSVHKYIRLGIINEWWGSHEIELSDDIGRE